MLNNVQFWAIRRVNLHSLKIEFCVLSIETLMQSLVRLQTMSPYRSRPRPSPEFLKSWKLMNCMWIISIDQQRTGGGATSYPTIGIQRDLSAHAAMSVRCRETCECHENYQHWTVKHREAYHPVKLFTDRYRIGSGAQCQMLFMSKASGKLEFHENYSYIIGAPNQFLYHYDTE